MKKFVVSKGLSMKTYVAVILVSLLAVAGCSTKEEAGKTRNPVLPGGVAQVSKAHNSFGFDMLKALDVNSEGKNVVVSPTSIALALSMVYNGADGDTKTEMEKALMLEGIDVTELNTASLDLIERLQDTDNEYTLEIANAIWAQDGFTVKQDFLDRTKKNYKSEVSNIDFDSPKAKGVINSWVKKNTNDKIDSIVDETHGLALFLANATYFKGAWNEEFDEERTRDGDFTNSDGKVTQVPKMSKMTAFKYKETEDFQAVNLKYGEDNRMSMYVILPKDIDTFINNLNGETWDQTVSGFKTTEVALRLPKFKTQYSQSLAPALKKLGMKKAFTDKADFTGIANGLFISSVQHKTFLEVNEKGTEAAAITGSGMTTLSAPTYLTMDVNRPFFMAIVDSATNEIIFTGSIRSL